jgi:Leucine-rich repeat (LRR) protein
MHHTSTTISLTYTAKLKKLVIRDADVVPSEIFEKYKDVKILDMAGGHLKQLPNDFNKLRCLEVLFLSDNDFEEIPPVLAKCEKLVMLGMRSCKITDINSNSLPASLRALILTNNLIESLPCTIEKLQNLQKLTLTGNFLSSLPNEVLQCVNLELIRLSANNFTDIPLSLLQLPRLAWYSDSGNPGSIKYTSPVPTNSQTFLWSDITILNKIGESSKNTVYEVRIKNYNTIFALKLYGSNLSADGYAQDEIDVSLKLKTHSNIIRCLGTIKGHPDQKQGLVMDLLPNNYRDLANPPDFETLTRDIYATGTQFSIDFVVTVLKNISSALMSLHGQNIMHGDLYAHNILVNEMGFAYLSDFGAATSYVPTTEKLHERVETRAFGNLASELLLNCIDPDNNTDKETLFSLKKLEQACLHDNVTQRPLFSDINKSL